MSEQETINDFGFSLHELATPIVYFPDTEDKSNKPGFVVMSTETKSPSAIKGRINLGKPGGIATEEQVKTYLETHPGDLLVLAAVNDPIIKKTGMDNLETRYTLFSFIEPHLSMSRSQLAKILAKKTPGTQKDIEGLQIRIITLDTFQERIFLPAAPNHSQGRRR